MNRFATKPYLDLEARWTLDTVRLGSPPRTCVAMLQHHSDRLTITLAKASPVAAAIELIKRATLADGAPDHIAIDMTADFGDLREWIVSQGITLISARPQLLRLERRLNRIRASGEYLASQLEGSEYLVNPDFVEPGLGADFQSM